MPAKKSTAFPCEIPEEKPGYATLALAEKWRDMKKRVSARMKKLRTVARVIMDDEDKIAYAIQRVFCDNSGTLITDEHGVLLLDKLPELAIVEAVSHVLPYVQWKEFARFPNAVAVVNCMFITTKEWELIRCMGFGGSDSAITVGIHKYESSSERSLFYSKTRLSLAGNDDGKAFIFQYGHEREPIVIDTFCRKTGAVVIPCPFLFRHKKHKWMTANIDAIVQMPDGSLAIFEAKTTSSHSMADWKVGPPIQYLRQPMQYMAVLNDPRIKRSYIGCVVSNVQDGWFCWPIDRDPAAEEDLIQHEEEFFVKYVEPGIVPDITGEKDKDLFAFFTYERSPEQIQAGRDVAIDPNQLIEIPLSKGGPDDPPEMESVMDALIRWQKLEAESKELKTQLEKVEGDKATIALTVFAALGDDVKSGYLDDASGMRYTIECRTTARTSVDKDALKLLDPALFARVAKTDTSVSAPSIKYKKVPKPKKTA